MWKIKFRNKWVLISINIKIRLWSWFLINIYFFKICSASIHSWTMYLKSLWRLNFLQGHYGLNFYGLSYSTYEPTSTAWDVFWSQCAYSIIVLCSSEHSCLQRCSTWLKVIKDFIHQWRKTQINPVFKRAQVRTCTNKCNFTENPSEPLM